MTKKEKQTKITGLLCCNRVPYSIINSKGVFLFEMDRPRWRNERSPSLECCTTPTRRFPPPNQQRFPTTVPPTCCCETAWAVVSQAGTAWFCPFSSWKISPLWVLETLAIYFCELHLLDWIIVKYHCCEWCWVWFPVSCKCWIELLWMVLQTHCEFDCCWIAVQLQNHCLPLNPLWMFFPLKKDWLCILVMYTHTLFIQSHYEIALWMR